jgi:hypothetical protein
MVYQISSDSMKNKQNERILVGKMCCKVSPTPDMDGDQISDSHNIEI